MTIYLEYPVLFFFSGKNKKTVISLLAPVFAYRALQVKLKK